jgi:hypothetical protein
MHFIANGLQAQTPKRLAKRCDGTVVFDGTGYERRESWGQQVALAHRFQSTFCLLAVFAALIQVFKHTAASGRMEKLSQRTVARIADVDELRIHRKHSLVFEHRMNQYIWPLTRCECSQRRLVGFVIKNTLQLPEVACKTGDACESFDMYNLGNKNSRLQGRGASNAEEQRESSKKAGHQKHKYCNGVNASKNAHKITCCSYKHARLQA